MTAKTSEDQAEKQVREIIEVTELSLGLIGLLYYYSVQLPRLQRKLRKEQNR